MPGARTGGPLGLSDTRNDLLFTMSDITHSSHALRASPQVHHAIKSEFVFLGREQNPDWWSQTGSNRRPPACKAGALPAELWPQKSGSVGAANRSSRKAPGLAFQSCFAFQATPGNLIAR